MGNLSTESTSDLFSPYKGSASLTQGHAELGADFVLQLIIDDISKPQAILERHSSLNSRAIMATLVPKFNLPLSTPEIIFIADQSGSMQGSKNEALKNALQVFLKSLPFGVRFNICAFGGFYNYLWEKSQPYNEETLEAASKFVDRFNAMHGGTVMFGPVEQAFKSRLGDLPLEIMLLTDGEIWGEQELFSLINEKIHNDKVDARVFTLGIGSDVSHTLVEGVARAGNGMAQFIADNEQADAQIVRMLRASLFPHTSNYSLEINYDDRDEDVEDDFELVEKVTSSLTIEDSATTPASTQQEVSFFDESAHQDTPMQTADKFAHLPKVVVPKVLQTPSKIPPLFPFNRTTLYFLLGPEAPQKNVVSVTLRAQAPSGPLRLTIPVMSEAAPGTTVHQLAARKAVQELEEGRGWIQEGRTIDGVSIKDKHASRLDEIVEQEAVRLGETFQVAGKWCAFVAVNGRSQQQQQPVADDDEEDLEGFTSFEDVNMDACHYDPTCSAPGYAPPPPAPMMAMQQAAMCQMASMRTAQPQRNSRALRMAPGGAAPARQSAAMQMASPSPQKPSFTASVASVFGASRKRKAAISSSPSTQGAAMQQSLPPACAQQAMAFSVSQRDRSQRDVSQPADQVRAIIQAQAFAGGWKWELDLLELLELSQETIRGLQPHNEVYATVLVLVYLEVKMASLRDVWEMVAEKARLWLDSVQSQQHTQQMMIDARGVMTT